MNSEEVKMLLGNPCEQIVFTDGVSVWHYRPWSAGNWFCRKKIVINEYKDVPYEYGRVAFVFDKGGVLQAKTYIGEDISVKTIHGEIKGDSLAVYWESMKKESVNNK
jgi:hypothetical protein